MPAFIASHRDLRSDLFITVGNEGGRNLANIWRLAAQFSVDGRRIPNLRWRLTPYADETHGSISLHAMDQALRAIFDGCCLDETGALAVFDHGGVAALQKHFAEVSQRMGYSVSIPRSAFAATVGSLRRANRTDEAKQVLEQAISAYPEDAEFYFTMGQLVGADRARAEEYFTKSLHASPTEYRNQIVGYYKFDAGKLLPEIAPSVHALKAYAGTYSAADDSRTIHPKGSSLVMSSSEGDCEMRFLSELRFYCGPELGEFEEAAGGHTRSVTLHTADYRYTLTKSK
jgi:tetratricopeptide (TPR) repeat protein